MVTIKLRNVEYRRGSPLDDVPGFVTFFFETGSPELDRHLIPVTVRDFGEEALSLEAARLALLRFARSLHEAAQQPIS